MGGGGRKEKNGKENLRRAFLATYFLRFTLE